MDYNKEVLIKNWLDKADIALIDADINVANGRLNNAQNRLYYAIFYSVVALGYYKGFTTSSHSELLGWFNKNLIKTGIFIKELGKTYKNAYDDRYKSDYTVTFEPSKEEIDRSIEEAKQFIDTIKTYIESNK